MVYRGGVPGPQISGKSGVRQGVGTWDEQFPGPWAIWSRGSEGAGVAGAPPWLAKLQHRFPEKRLIFGLRENRCAEIPRLFKAALTVESQEMCKIINFFQQP